MPESLHPPYVPASVYQPRQLNRWLDVNAQNGPLTRTQTFITLPTFSVASTWKGYSEIVAAFNFEGPNAFSFTSLVSELPINPNYMLCVMYIDHADMVHRYSFWRGVGEVIYFGITPYGGQPILKNFRLEIWNTHSTPTINTQAINFYTSVAGNVDYRFAADSALSVADTIVTNFQCANTIPPTPPVVATDYFNPQGILGFEGTYISWTPTQGAGNISVTLNTPTTPNDDSALILTTAGIHVNLSSTTTPLANLYIILNQTSNISGGIIITKADNTQLYNMQISYISGVLTLQTPQGNIPIPSNDISGINLSYIAGVLTLTVYNKLGQVVGTKSGASAALSVSYINIDLIDLLYEVIHTVAPLNFSNYIHSIYGTGIPLPFVFPTNAVPANN